MVFWRSADMLVLLGRVAAGGTPARDREESTAGLIINVFFFYPI